MLTLRGQRLLNALLAGGYTGVTLETELGDANAKFALRELLDGSPRHARMLLANSTARTALLGSALARGILVECRTALAVAAKERDIILALASDANTRTAINASTTALRAIASDDGGTIAWMAQLMGVGGNFAKEPVALFRSAAAFANSAPALFLIAVSPTLAAAMCLAGKPEGLNATIDATLNGSALFTRIGNESFTDVGANNGNREVRWQDDVLMLGGFWTTGGSSGTLYLYGSHTSRSRKTVLKTSTNSESGTALSFCAPRGFWYENIGGSLMFSYIAFTTYVAK